jgi:hypothetical protein
MSGNMAQQTSDVAVLYARLTRHVTSRLKMAATPVVPPAPVFQPDPFVLLSNNNLECSRPKGNRARID